MIEDPSIIKTISVEENLLLHLNKQYNYRIIFSGKFGIGKTFVIKKFFENNKESFNTIILSPVNYVVSTNEDIFEYIKVDIIRSLFLNDYITSKKTKKKSKLDTIDLFTGENPQHLFKFLTNSLKSINPFFKITNDFIEAFAELKKKFDEYEKQLTKELKLPNEVLFDFIESFGDSKGSLFEDNFITRTINSTLDDIRRNKRNVLVIDDLDRIDPDHIFRILNIFSAHNDYFNTENKFLFDHVIFVCDIKNIEHIYLHCYGSNVDFEGYINKFFSSEILYYSNKQALQDYIYFHFSSASNISYLSFVSYFLNLLIEKEQVVLRKILKHKFEINIKYFVLKEQNGIKINLHYIGGQATWLRSKDFYVSSTDASILLFFKLMSIIMGDFKGFKKSLEELKDKVSSEKISLKTHLPVIEYLALQYHLITKKGNELYVHIPDEGHGFYSEVYKPRVHFLKYNFTIELLWNNKNPYTNSSPYFEHARASIIMNTQELENVQVSLKDIIDAVSSISNELETNGYLFKAKVLY